jgi:hypothetical protein
VSTMVIPGKDGASSRVQLWKCTGLYIRIDERIGQLGGDAGLVRITTPEHAHADDLGNWTPLEVR